jgi:hypothetical protein
MARQGIARTANNGTPISVAQASCVQRAGGGPAPVAITNGPLGELWKTPVIHTGSRD